MIYSPFSKVKYVYVKSIFSWGISFKSLIVLVQDKAEQHREIF